MVGRRLGHLLGRLLGRLLGELLALAADFIDAHWSVIRPILALLAIALALCAALALFTPHLLTRRRRGEADEAGDGQPDRAAALALLEHADRLAAQGR